MSVFHQLYLLSKECLKGNRLSRSVSYLKQKAPEIPVWEVEPCLFKLLKKIGIGQKLVNILSSWGVRSKYKERDNETSIAVDILSIYLSNCFTNIN